MDIVMVSVAQLHKTQTECSEHLPLDINRYRHRPQLVGSQAATHCARGPGTLIF